MSKRILILVSNPAASAQTGWPIGFWWAELTHAWWEFTQAGYEVTVASPDGGKVEGDALSDPRHESGYSAADVVSLGFISSPGHAALLNDTPALDSLDVNDFDAVFLVGGMGPMYTFRHNPKVEELVTTAYESGKVTVLVCHATAVLLDARTGEGTLLAEGKTWTGFANSEEDIADQAAGQRIQPFRIEDEARAISGTNFIVHPPFQPHAVRDGNLITAQQQNSGPAAARLVIEALGR